MEQGIADLCDLSIPKVLPSKQHFPGGRHFIFGSYGIVRFKNFYYESIPEFWGDLDTQSQNMYVVSDQCLLYKTIGKLLIIPNLGISNISGKN